jgi:L-2-hydroxyglutarate oxidase LhgO
LPKEIDFANSPVDHSHATMSIPTSDVIVVGAGAIGASTAYHLAQLGVRVTVLEKEAEPALHQSSRNSGVIHAGYNLKPGSAKARFCVEGNHRLRAYCLAHGIPMFQGGILVVASEEAGIPTLRELKRRADANGVESRIVDAAELCTIEPHAAGVQALHAPEGASFDPGAFVRQLMLDAARLGATAQFRVQVLSVEERHSVTGGQAGVRVWTTEGPFHARALVNCAGLHADRVAGPIASDLRLVPFRGYYAELRPERRTLVRSHVYAAPDLEFPFLGVHVSRQADGRVLIGPGAMLAFGREAYKLHHVKPRDLAETLAWPGFYRFLAQSKAKHLMRSEVRKSLFLRAIWREARALVPELRPRDLIRSFAGNRAQLITRDGKLVDDILIRETEHAVHVLNAVSPGLTASLPFGEDLSRRVKQKLA